VTQAQWLTLALKVALIAGFASLAGWVILYSLLASWRASPIGRTLVAKTTLIALLFVPTALSLFFRLNRLDSYIAGWVDASLIGLVSPVMWWRSLVWWRLHKAGRLPRDGNDGNQGGTA
jgi:hypothetical protein